MIISNFSMKSYDGKQLQYGINNLSTEYYDGKQLQY